MSKKTVLITGCSDGGLGAALAVAFHQTKQWRVLATARNPAKMASLTAMGIETVALDVLSETSVKSCVERVTKMTESKLDMIVNNAGAGLMMPISDVDVLEAKKIFDLNVWSVVAVNQAFLPLLLRNPSGATIVNHTSIASVVFPPFQGIYSASKAAIAAITESMRFELEAFNIRVIDLKSGAVKSNFFQSSAAINSPQIPPDSIYSPARDRINQTLTGAQMEKIAMPADKWGAQVVSDLTGSSHPPNVVWRGASAVLIKWLKLLPSWLLDGEFKKMMGLDEINKKIAAERMK